jgi:hypothetical protein
LNGSESNTMSKKQCNEGLDDRCRDQDGQIRAKNGSTLVRTLRQTYGEDFAPGVRSDMKLDTLLERTGAQSPTELLKKASRPRPARERAHAGVRGALHHSGHGNYVR